jgi:hypothetical protein
MHLLVSHEHLSGTYAVRLVAHYREHCHSQINLFPLFSLCNEEWINFLGSLTQL